ncbi:MAG TPA: dethiobiotin synthase [Candidatus Saccharimonadales bacterium]|jgi:dethiobiotin synthetase|nr:dethiobiotin synthase [Candidatus Saccharimonadales bacterium]
MGNGFFITGTDTNAGKTVLAALLCAALPGAYWKPIQTGASEGSDRQQVKRWAALEEAQLLPEAYLFDDPVSPHLAAERAGREIILEQIELPAQGEGLPWIVEGAGGVMAPVNSRQFMIDLMRHLALPVVLAARSTLGTINHTLLSLQCLRNAGLETRGVVMIGPENCENRKAIERYGKIQVIGQIPMLATINRQRLREVYARHFSREAFR